MARYRTIARRFTAALAAAGLSLAVQSPLLAADGGNKTAIFAGGCFWCVESDFDKVDGVVATISGYTGGSAETATYKQVSHGGTGHHESVKIVYDPKKVTYKQLLYVFWRSVDPTDPGGQFCDRGDSYKTGIFVANEEERRIAEASKRRAEKELGQKIVTQIVKAGPFYKAEDYHQNYYIKNPYRYKFYRYGCGRDARIRELWGDKAHAGIEH